MLSSRSIETWAVQKPAHEWLIAAERNFRIINHQGGCGYCISTRSNQDPAGVFGLVGGWNGLCLFSGV